MENYPHSYEIEKIKNGFAIVPKDKNKTSVPVCLDKYGMWHITDKDFCSNTKMMFHFYGLVEDIVDNLYLSWEPPAADKNHYKKQARITAWAKGHTARTLNRRIHEEWENCIKQADPEIVDFQKSIFTISPGNFYDTERLKALLDHRDSYKFYIKDIIKYRPAAITFCYYDGLFSHKHFEPDWMKSFAFNDNVYRTLARTLMNFPYGVPGELSLAIKHIVIPEPATSKLKYMAYSLIGDGVFEERIIDNFINVVHKSSEEDIKNAIKYMWYYFPNSKTGDFRRTHEVIDALRNIFDYPFTLGNWDILGLARRSEEYHHDLRLQELARLQEEERMQEKLKLEHEKMMAIPTSLPPISLPDNNSIQFLKSYGDIISEGERMQHCIGTYAEGATKGKYYLFHVSHKGETASVQVDPKGYVVQSYGPRDTKNEASEYGRRYLNKWAKGLQGV